MEVVVVVLLVGALGWAGLSGRSGEMNWSGGRPLLGDRGGIDSSFIADRTYVFPAV